MKNYKPKENYSFSKRSSAIKGLHASALGISKEGEFSSKFENLKKTVGFQPAEVYKPKENYSFSKRSSAIKGLHASALGISKEGEFSSKFENLKKTVGFQPAEVYKKQSGQTLLEVIVVLAVLGLVLGGLVTVILNGLRNSQFSKNQAQATKLGQEALDIVRIMKDREDCTVVVAGTTYYWINNSPMVWESSAFVANKIYTPSLQPTCLLQQITTPEAIGANFSRSIKLEADGMSTDRIKVTAIVSWNDVSGSHESNLVTILAQ